MNPPIISPVPLKTLFQRLLLGLLLFSPAGWAVLADADAVNLAGMQRMLSQRIAKDYLMIAVQVRSDVATRQLEQSLAQFESNLASLEPYADVPAIEPQRLQVAGLWQAYRSEVLAPSSRDGALRVLALSDQLLAECETLVQRIEQHSAGQSAHLVNRSGRQRMLSQRIASLYLALSWHLPKPELQADFEQAVNEFSQALEELRAAPQNTAPINAALTKIEAQWAFSRSGFRLSASTQYVPTLITTTCDTLLKQMEALVLAYAELPVSEYP